MKNRKPFRELGIRKQTQYIAFAVLAMFIVMCGLISVSIRRLVCRNEEAHMQVTSLRLYDQISLINDKMENYCINISGNEYVRALMESDYQHMSTATEGVIECLAGHKILEPMVKDISLVNDRIHYSDLYRTKELDEIRRTVNGAPFSWLGFRSRSFRPDAWAPDIMVYAGDIITGTEHSGMENVGTVVLSVDPSGLLAESEGGSNQMYFLADKERVLFTFGQPTEQVMEAYRLWQETGWKDQADTGDYSICSRYFDNMDFYLLSVLDIRRIGAGTDRIQILIWGCVLQAAGFCIIFYLMLTKGLIMPLRQFHETILQIRQSNQRGLKTGLRLGGCAEITELGDEFTGMLEDIEKLNRKIFQSAMDLYELKVQKQEAELAYLRSQVDPHFLYNTLEVVRKMALDKDAPEIAQMALDMGSIFRYSAKGEDEVLLEEEIAIVKSYIRIQQLRFQGKIEVFYFIAEETLKLKVMKMLLQPLVENSIFHGLEPRHIRGSLYIGARLLEGGQELIITVKDDGVGIAPDRLEKLQRQLAENDADTREHVGILNTHARLRLFYGEGYGVSVESRPGDGTTVTLRLAAKE